MLPVAITTTQSVDAEVAEGISHDIRNSVAALRLLVEAVRDGVLTATPASSAVAQMVVHVGLLEALINAQSAREERHGVALAHKADVATLLEEWTQVMQLKASHREVYLRLVIRDDLPRIPCRPDQIARVLLNLIGNAIRHTPPGGTVHVRAVTHPGGVQIQVDDTGPGLTRSDRADLNRAPTAASGPRAGLGLAIARRIVEAHGGALWAGTPRHGASLRFYLPAVAAAASGRLFPPQVSSCNAEMVA